jgi:predicted membrane-bound dolichyl-phosphate-mannose-protein mannosyltransferase
VLIFDEAYYVNAARVIAGVRPPERMPYANSPLGTDPNSEHPQLGKLVIAGAIELFGDGPLAWRIGSVILGLLAIVGLSVLVRAASGGAGVAVGAAALMASDNLLLVHGRIGTLDVYALCAMVWGAALYLRGRPLLAGVVIGAGAASKLVALYVLLALAALEALRLLKPGAALKARVWPVIKCVATSAGALLALLVVLDRLAPPYDDTAGKRVGGGALGHLAHMLSFASHQTSPHGPRGIASYPWQWLADYKPIPYLNVNPARPADGLYHVHPGVHFLGFISPPILLLALPALALAARQVHRRLTAGSGDLLALGLAWFACTFLPFELLSALWSRTSYLYYMVIVMPAIYVLVAELMVRRRLPRAVRIAWVAAVAAAAVILYPFTPLP